MMRDPGSQAPFGATGAGFPAPGMPSTAANTGSPSSPQPQTPLGSGNTGLFPSPGSPGAASTSPTIGGNPFGGLNPAMMQSLLGGMGGSSPFGAGAGLGGGFGGAPVPPADARSPEERFQVQLQVQYLRSTQLSLPLIRVDSNYKTWASRTRLKTLEHYWLLVGTFILQ